MKIKLVFLDWQKGGESIYSTDEGVELSMGLFHSGTTFEGSIVLDPEDAQELAEAIKQGYQPCFWVTL